MIGIEQAGIAETMDFVLKKFDAETQNKLAQVQYMYSHSFIMKNNILCSQNNIFSILSIKVQYNVYVKVISVYLSLY